MATYQSNIMVKQTGSNAGKLKPSEFGGRVRVVHGSIVPASAYAAGSVIELARLKNDALFAAYRAQIGDTPVLSADTVVWSPAMKKPLGKPRDADDARRMLSALSGKTHEVWTGVVIRAGEHESAFAVSTEVRFRDLTAEEIDEYVNSGDPLDKAGAYGYQSGACVFVEEIRGDYYNVVWLPVCRVAEELMRLGI